MHKKQEKRHNGLRLKRLILFNAQATKAIYSISVMETTTFLQKKAK